MKSLPYPPVAGRWLIFAGARRIPAGGFTRVDFLVVVLTLGVVLVMLLPALGKGRVQPQGSQCLSNLRQITLGVLLYADDNRGNMPINIMGATTGLNWIGGYLDYNGSTDDTNAALLVNPARSQMAAYVPNPAVYRCPADQSAAYGLTGLPRVRSYSMNAAIGCNATGTATGQGFWLPYPNYTVFLKTSQMVNPTPAGLWMLLDEDPDSINDGSFAFLMPHSPVATTWVDMPAQYHENACGFSFADGHTEMHAWRAPGNIPVPTYSVSLSETGYPELADPDILWMASHTSAKP